MSKETISDPHSTATTALIGVVAVLVNELVQCKAIDRDRFERKLAEVLSPDEANSQPAEKAMLATVLKLMKSAVAQGARDE